MPELPSWATDGGKTAKGMRIIEVDADAAYKAWLADLDVKKPDRYWLETAYQCIKMDVQVASGEPIEMRWKMDSGYKNWSQTDYPAGKGAAAATLGREARDHYRRIRGFVPG